MCKSLQAICQQLHPESAMAAVKDSGKALAKHQKKVSSLREEEREEEGGEGGGREGRGGRGKLGVEEEGREKGEGREGGGRG